RYWRTAPGKWINHAALKATKGGATNEARLCFTGQRTANISKIWKAVWAGRAAQVVVVVSGQAVWSITSDKLLSCGNASKNIDALAIAPYFGSYNATRDTNLTIFMNTTLPAQVSKTIDQVKLHADIAAKYGKPLLAYEAGQGMTGDGSSTDLAIQVGGARRDGHARGPISLLEESHRIRPTRIIASYPPSFLIQFAFRCKCQGETLSTWHSQFIRSIRMYKTLFTRPFKHRPLMLPIFVRMSSALCPLPSALCPLPSALCPL
ncbi:hypothetical protein Vretifemale_15933, partial [Volvox reticuliferus]